MPNYAITSVYQPFSFQERIAPLQMLKEEYDKIGEALATYSDDSNAYYQYLDPDTRSKVDKYNATLQSVADSLSREGLKAVSRNTLFDLKRMYNSQIKPINEAAKGYAELQDQVRKMQMQDPTLIINNMPTVGDLMGNPGAMPSMVSGKTLYQQGTLAASQLPDISYDQIQRYLAGDTSAIPNMNAIASQIGGMYGLENLDEAGRQRALGYIMQGLGDGLSARTAEQAAYENKLRLQAELDHKKIWDQAAASVYAAKKKTDENLRLALGKAEIAAASGGSSGKGTIYDSQAKYSYYRKGDTIYNGEFDKDAISSERAKGTRAIPVIPENLSERAKRELLEYAGIKVPEGSSINDLIKRYSDRLSELYQTFEYIGNGSRRDPDEFYIVPKSTQRQTNTSSYPGGTSYDEEDYADFVL